MILFFVIIMTLTQGEYALTFNESIKSLFGKGTAEGNAIVQSVRLPRLIGGVVVGCTLALSGIFMKIALQNPLADSGILGIQSGGTTAALIVILYFPLQLSFLPIVAFIGGMIAFTITIIASSKNGLRGVQLVLSGVAVNALFSSIIGIITILNVTKLQGALTYLSGSLTTVSKGESNIMLTMAVIAIVSAYILIPVINMLRLGDNRIRSLGFNPVWLRFSIATFAVMCASITVSFVGVVSFIGVIIPNIAKQITKGSIAEQMTTSLLLGAIFVCTADLCQKLLFAPAEIPVGLIVGILSAPVFLFILRSDYGTKVE